MRERNAMGIVACVLLAAFVMQGCARPPQQEEKIIATINDEPLNIKDLNRALALSFKRDPTFKVSPRTLERQVNMLIDKRLLIQEARKRKLDQTDRFVNTIKTFWEQTLLRDLLAAKDSEIRDSISVNEEEMKDYYDKMSHRKTFQVVGNKDRDLITKLSKLGPESVNWQKTVGPIGYEDVSSNVFIEAFEIPEGEMKVIRDGDVYFLFYTREDETVPVAPFDEIKDEIKQKVADIKAQRLLRKWLRGIREKADIKLNRDVLEEVKQKYD